MNTPPLAHVTGTVQPGEVFGGFGPVDAFTWRGSCVGGCGARPGCREESPRPECSGCGRQRTGARGGDGAIGRIVPVPARILPGELDGGRPVNLPVAQPVNQPVTVLRPAQQVSPCDASLPAAVRSLVKLAPAGVRVTAAVAARNGLLVASIAVRVRGVGWAVYEREGDAWGFAGGALVVPHLRRCNVGQFKAALTGAEYVPPAPRVARKGTCPACQAEVSITAAGAIYASHRCGTTKAVEGRS